MEHGAWSQGTEVELILTPRSLLPAPCQRSTDGFPEPSNRPSQRPVPVDDARCADHRRACCLAVVVVSVGYLFQYQSAGPDEFLFGGQFFPTASSTRSKPRSPRPASTATAARATASSCPPARSAAYLAAVVDGGALPPNFHTYLENALDQGGPWESARSHPRTAQNRPPADAQRNHPPHALGRGRRRALRRAAAARTPSRQSKSPPRSASRRFTGESLDPRRTTRIAEARRPRGRRHAARRRGRSPAWATPSGLGGDGDVFAESFDDEYYQIRVAYEQYKKNCILNALRDIPGIRVEVSAELDDTIQETVQNLKPDKQGTALKTLTVEETTSVRHPRRRRPAGRHRPRTQPPGRPAAARPARIEQDLQDHRRSRQPRRPGTAAPSSAPASRPRKIGPRSRSRGPTSKTSGSSAIPMPRMRRRRKTSPLSRTTSSPRSKNIVVPLLTRQNKGRGRIQASPRRDRRFDPDAGDRAAVVRQQCDGLDRPLLELVGDDRRRHVQPAGAQVGRERRSAAAVRRWPRPPRSRSTPMRTATPKAAPIPMQPQRTHVSASRKASRSRTTSPKWCSEDPDAAAAILKSWIGKAG